MKRRIKFVLTIEERLVWRGASGSGEHPPTTRPTSRSLGDYLIALRRFYRKVHAAPAAPASQFQLREDNSSCNEQ